MKGFYAPHFNKHGIRETPRQREYLPFVRGGMKNREIADALCVTEKTVKAMLRQLYINYGVSGRPALILKLAELDGVVKNPEP